MSTLVSLWLQDYSWYIGILCRFCMGDWSEAEPGESFWWVSRQGGHRSSSNILIDKSLATHKMLSLAFDWTISFSWLMWPRETEMFSLSSRQSRYWVLLPLHQVTTHLPSCELTYLTKHGYLLLPCFVHAQVSSKLFRALYMFSRSSNAVERWGVFEIAAEWPDTPMHL